MKAIDPVSHVNIDWQAAAEETVRHLQRLIQMDTRNPPGNELPLARYLEAVLAAEGIETHLFEPFRNRAALIGRIRGTGEREPVMLLAHMDVVGVEPEMWSVDPFGGSVLDGYLYGRGAIDDKGMLAVNLMTMLLLQRHVVRTGGALARDVVFVATSDEEAGGAYGIQWLIENHPEMLRAEFALNEGGRLRIVGDRLLYAAVQTAEKVSHVVNVTARGPAGHAAIPLPGNAVARLGRALALIGAHREAMLLLPTTRRFFTGLAGVWPDKRVADAMRDVVAEDRDRATAAARILSETPVFDAVLRTGISPTMLAAGTQSNVIPGEAHAVLCVRTLPGDSLNAVVEHLSLLVDDPDVEISVKQASEDAPASSLESPLFAAIERVVRALSPETVTVPYLSTGATDSAHLRRLGVQAFGLLPFAMVEDDEKRMHGHDERVPVESLGLGTRLIFAVIHDVAT